MLTIEKIDPFNKAHVERFVRIHFNLYQKCPQWVPPILDDCRMQLNKKKHPYYEHSEADFFIAVKDGQDVGRVAAHENKPFNQYHKTRKGSFYLFDCIDDQDVANGLFARVFEWARQRKLDTIVGPKGLSAFDGYGIQVEGFEHRQMMNMMNYNYAYYPRLLDAISFEKEVDFVSCYAHRENFQLPDRVRRIADRVEERGKLKVIRFKNKQHLLSYANRIGEAYNKTFVNNWEYYPLSEREVKFVVDNIMLVADYRLIKLVMYEEDVVGFLFAFPDVSRAMQRAKGHLFPFGIVDLLQEMKRTDWISLNGVGVLPEFQGMGGNALMYAEMARAVNASDFKFVHAELTQVAETAVQMRRDLINLGGKPYKNHRIYRKSL